MLRCSPNYTLPLLSSTSLPDQSLRSTFSHLLLLSPTFAAISQTSRGEPLPLFSLTLSPDPPNLAVL